MALASACCVPLSRASRVSVCAFLVGNDRGCLLRSRSMPGLLRLGLDPRLHLARLAPVLRAQHLGDVVAFGRRVGIEVERMVLDIDDDAGRQLGDRLVEPLGADEAPRTDNVGPQIDLERKSCKSVAVALAQCGDGHGKTGRPAVGEEHVARDRGERNPEQRRQDEQQRRPRHRREPERRGARSGAAKRH